MADQAKRRESKSEHMTQRRAGEQTLFVGAKRAIIGGTLAVGVALVGQWFVGRVYSGTEARNLVDAHGAARARSVAPL